MDPLVLFLLIYGNFWSLVALYLLCKFVIFKR